MDANSPRLACHVLPSLYSCQSVPCGADASASTIPCSPSCGNTRRLPAAGTSAEPGFRSSGSAAPLLSSKRGSRVVSPAGAQRNGYLVQFAKDARDLVGGAAGDLLGVGAGALVT